MDAQPEALHDLEDSLSRERVLKGGLAVAALLWLAYTQGETHPYVPIVLFMLLADLMSLNRQRRIVATLRDRDAALHAALQKSVTEEETDKR